MRSTVQSIVQHDELWSRNKRGYITLHKCVRFPLILYSTVNLLSINLRKLERGSIKLSSDSKCEYCTGRVQFNTVNSIGFYVVANRNKIVSWQRIPGVRNRGFLLIQRWPTLGWHYRNPYPLLSPPTLFLYSCTYCTGKVPVLSVLY